MSFQDGDNFSKLLQKLSPSRKNYIYKGGTNQKPTRSLPSMSKFIDRIKDEEVSGETLPLFSVFTHSFRLTCPRLLTLKPKR